MKQEFIGVFTKPKQNTMSVIFTKIPSSARFCKLFNEIVKDIFCVINLFIKLHFKLYLKNLTILPPLQLPQSGAQREI